MNPQAQAAVDRGNIWLYTYDEVYSHERTTNEDKAKEAIRALVKEVERLDHLLTIAIDLNKALTEGRED